MTRQQSTHCSRRSWLTAVGVLLAAGGAAGVIGRTTEFKPSLSLAEQAFWLQQFKQVDGSPLSMAGFRGKPLVVNFWATWCPPCLAELPLLNAFYTENASKSWQVMGLAIDQLAQVKRFLIRNPLIFPVAMAGFEGTDLSRSLGNMSGGLPFTVVFGPAGNVWHRKIGQLTSKDLAAWRQIELS